MLPSVLCAETLYLKNGRKLEGRILEDDGVNVELQIRGGTVKFRKSEILEIKKAAANEVDADFLPGGGITVDAVINENMSAKLLVDTGASVVTLNPSLAEKLGIDASQATEKGKAIVADGREVDAFLVRLKSLKIGQLEAKEVDAIVLSNYTPPVTPGVEPVDGLLGMSFIDRYHMRVDAGRKKLIFES